MSMSSGTASPSTTVSQIPNSPRAVLPPIMGLHPSGPFAFSKHPPSPDSPFEQSPQVPSAHLPPPLPKAGIHPFSRSNSFSHTPSHDSSGPTEDDDDVDEPAALSASPLDTDVRRSRTQPSRRKWKRGKKITRVGHGDGHLKQHDRRLSGMNILLNSNRNRSNVWRLSPAVTEMLTQDFAPVTRDHVSRQLRRMDEEEYRRVELFVSEKYADRLTAHPWFLNNLTALLCVVEEDGEDAQVKGQQGTRESDDQDMSMEVDAAPPSSSHLPLKFMPIHSDVYSHQPAEQSCMKGLQGLTITPHEEISEFTAIISEKKQQQEHSDDRFLAGRISLPPHAYCLKELLAKNFTLSADPAQWGLYRFQEYPDLRFVVLNSVIQEYRRTKAQLEARRYRPEDESQEDGEGDGYMAVDSRVSDGMTVHPRYRMALTLMETLADEERDQVPQEMLEAFGQFDWTLSDHTRRVCFFEQPPMGLSHSSKVWTRFDRLVWHPTESEILHRDYEMLLPPTPTADVQQNQEVDEKSVKDEETEAVVARFVHTDSLAPAMVALLWADMFMTYKTTGSLFQNEGNLSGEEEDHIKEEDEQYEYDDEEEEVEGEEEDEEEAADYDGEVKHEDVDAQVRQDGEQRDAEEDDGADRISTSDSFHRWRMTRRSTSDSNSTSASRRDSAMPSLSLAMSTFPAVATTTPTSPTTLMAKTVTGSTALPAEEQGEPLTTPSISKENGVYSTSMASPATSVNTASALAGRRISIAELCSPMLTLGNTTNSSASN
ncbi:hypothetical protein DFQ27_003496 [Actinomortierella ambigua]|uniref:Uncharacterized protein n=1 Tax=Actinomortierella ambigua TaxID=1343610 RepID=A0A9P6Q4K1_9FUNG|nr:hypothetical protein DFQ27_003496 [Actinomortierella ambigua]